MATIAAIVENVFSDRNDHSDHIETQWSAIARFVATAIADMEKKSISAIVAILTIKIPQIGICKLYRWSYIVDVVTIVAIIWKAGISICCKICFYALFK